MGNNLSSTFVPDTSKDVLSAPDAAADIMVAVIWASVLYACAMIWSTCALVDRWKGPTDKIRVGGGSVLAALVLSTAWPVVMGYLVFAG